MHPSIPMFLSRSIVHLRKTAARTRLRWVGKINFHRCRALHVSQPMSPIHFVPHGSALLCPDVKHPRPISLFRHHKHRHLYLLSSAKLHRYFSKTEIRNLDNSGRPSLACSGSSACYHRLRRSTFRTYKNPRPDMKTATTAVVTKRLAPFLSNRSVYTQINEVRYRAHLLKPLFGCGYDLRRVDDHAPTHCTCWRLEF